MRNPGKGKKINISINTTQKGTGREPEKAC